MPRRRWSVAFGLAGLVGFVLLLLPGTVVEAVGAVLLGLMLGAIVWWIVGLLGPQSQPDRAREAQAREEFERTGEWPAD